MINFVTYRNNINNDSNNGDSNGDSNADNEGECAKKTCIQYKKNKTR